MSVTFSCGNSLPQAIQHLSKIDPILGGIATQLPAIELSHRPVTFEYLVRVITRQQLSGAAADTIFSRLLRSCSDEISPHSILALQDSEVRSCGISNSKVRFIRGLAQHMKQRPLFLDEVASAEDKNAHAMLTEINGIGPWSADIFLLFNLRRPDIFPRGDGTLIRTVSKLYRKRKESKVYEVAETWRPYRSAAALLLWAWNDR